MNQILYDCEVHGLVLPNVITVLDDRANGVLTLALSCPICDKVKEDAKRKTESVKVSDYDLWMASHEFQPRRD